MKRILLCLTLITLISIGSAEYQQYKVDSARTNFGDETDVSISNSLSASVIGVCARSSVTQSLPCTHNGVIYVKCGTYINAYNANTNAFITSVDTSTTYNHVDTLICGNNYLYSPYGPLDELGYFNYTTLDFAFGDVKTVYAQTMDSSGNIYIITDSGKLMKYDSELLYSVTSSRYTNCTTASMTQEKTHPHIVVNDNNVYVVCSISDNSIFFITQYDTNVNYITNSSKTGGGQGGIIQSADYGGYLYVGFYGWGSGQSYYIFQLYDNNVTRNKSSYHVADRGAQNSLSTLSINPVTSSLIFTSRYATQEAYSFGLSSISTYTQIAPRLNGSNTPYMTTNNAYFFTPKGILKTTTSDISTVTESYTNTPNLWGGIIYNGKAFIWNSTHFMSLGNYTTTTTTLPPVGGNNTACNYSSQCPSGMLCYNGSCVITNQWCFIDGDCNTGEWCNTANQPNTCEIKVGGGGGCDRSHECVSNNCSANYNNTALGDYPDNGVLYPYNGICINSNITLCYADGDCNATSFCNNHLGGGGICETKRQVGQYCANSSWCTSGISCISAICQNSSDITSGCDYSHPDYYWDGYHALGYPTPATKPIWDSCIDINPLNCATFEDCFCGLLNENATTYSCIPRKNNNAECSLFRSVYANIEQKYQDREEACLVGYTCMGQTVGNIFRTCTNSECRRTLSNGQLLPNTFQDEYCDNGYWCNSGTCQQVAVFGQNCTANEQCESGICQTGTCRIGTTGATKIDLTISPSKIIASGDSISASGYYRYSNNNTGISNPTCTIIYVTSELNITDTNVITQPNGFFQTHTIYPITRGDTFNASLGITCTKTGVTPATGYATITVLSNTTTSSASITCSSCPSGIMQVSGAIFSVRYKSRATGNTITGATCELTLDGDNLGSLNYLDGVYQDYVSFSYDTHTYTITCSKSGYSTETLGGNFIARSSGVTTTTLTPQQNAQCNDGIKNYHESDIDCGGTSPCERCGYWLSCTNDDDCDDGLFCRLHTGTYYDINTQTVNKCDYANCTDGWKNGGETGIDCEGLCQSCGCSDQYSLTNCNDTGIQSCNMSNSLYGFCQTWSCPPTCTPLMLRINGVITSRDRVCVDGYCKFDNGTGGATSLTQIVYPLTNIIYQNGTTNFYLGYCSDFTNGLQVTTSKETDTQYQIGISPFSPNIPSAGANMPFGTRGTYKKMAIPELCQWNSGTLRYARIGIVSIIPNSNQQKQSTVDMIIFRDAYKVNFTGNGDMINMTANRESFFWIRGYINSPYIQLNTVPVKSIEVYYMNITNTSSIEEYANSTYGEVATNRYGRNALLVASMALGLIWDIGFAWWLPEWQNWYIIPIVFSIIVGLLFFSFCVWMALKTYENRNLNVEKRMIQKNGR